MNIRVYPSPQIPSLSATGVACVSTAGDFTIVFTDARANLKQDGEVEMLAVEVARVRLTAGAFVGLLEQLPKAVEFHEKAFGPLPSTADIAKAYGDQNAAQTEWLIPPPAPPNA